MKRNILANMYIFRGFCSCNHVVEVLRIFQGFNEFDPKSSVKDHLITFNELPSLVFLFRDTWSSRIFNMTFEYYKHIFYIKNCYLHKIFFRNLMYIFYLDKVH
jgi:hypothetical protein